MIDQPRPAQTQPSEPDPAWPGQPQPAQTQQPDPAWPGQPQPSPGPDWANHPPVAGPYPGVAGPGLPGQPYPGFPPQPVSEKVNGFAIASLIFGVLGGVLFGILFGIIALIQIRKRKQGGRGLAIGGIALAGMWLVAIVLIVTISVTTGQRGSTGKDTVSVTALQPGDCLNPDDLDESRDIWTVPVLSCGRPHGGEVVAVFSMPAGPWPGEAAVEEYAQIRCGADLDRYVRNSEEDLELLYLYPVRSSWSRNRVVTCIVADPAGPRTGSLRD